MINWRILRAVLGALLTLLVCTSLLRWSLPITDAIDRQLYDARTLATEAPPATRVIIVDIDERSLGEIGRWPWSRGRVADLVDRIGQRGHAAVIGFDILFAESQIETSEDQALVDALRRTPTVLGYYFSSDRGGRVNGQLPAPVMESQSVRDLKLDMLYWTGYGASLPELQAVARGAGFFNSIIDPDGVIRRLPLLSGFGDKVYDSFAMAVLKEYLGSASLILRNETIELRGRKGEASIPFSDGLGVLVPFARLAGSSAGRFVSVSAADLLQDKVDWSLFKDKIVLVGTSAPGLVDLRTTPISENLPGVEVHAALIESALQSAGSRAGGQAGATTETWSADTNPVPIRQRPAEGPLLSAVTVAAVGLLLAMTMPALGALGVLGLGLCGLVGLAAWNWLAWSRLGWDLPVSAGLVLVLALTGMNLALGYFLEGRARRAVANLFGEYVSPDLVDQMTRDPARFVRMTSENRELSIMFTDIRGFTRIAESMEPADLREFINEFLTAMTEVIHRHHGTVDKYIGDAVMAFWGAPVEDPAHADRAVSAAQAMLLEVDRLNRVNSRRGWPTLVIGVGINTGVARVGDMGSKLRRAYTVLGDAVNLASRIESLTKQFGSPIIVGESTARQAQEHVFSELAQVSIAGRNEQVRIYVPVTDGEHGTIGLHGDTRPFIPSHYPNALKSSAAHEATRLRL